MIKCCCRVPRVISQLAIAAALLAACAHASECPPSRCTADPVYEGVPTVCADIQGTERRLCGMLVNDEAVFVIRHSCKGPREPYVEEEESSNSGVQL